MAAGYQELFLEQGTSYATTLTLADVSGDPYNLTNYTAKSQMKKSYYSSNTTAEFSISIISSIFFLFLISSSSWNMASCSPPSDLSEWIPSATDSYARFFFFFETKTC